MTIKLPPEILSEQDFKAVILEIKAYSKWFADASVKTKLKIKQSLMPPNLSSTSVAIVKDFLGDKTVSQAELDKLIASLEDFHANVPTMTITLAAPPSNGIKKSLVVWCRQNIDPKLFVNFNFNTTILGGLVIRYGSHVYDWSFRRQILSERSKFAEVLRRV